MSQVAVIAKIAALEGKRAELAQALKAALVNAESESGTLKYILHEDANDENLLWFYELYSDQDALVAHGSSDAFKEVGMACRPFAAGRPELIMLNPLGGKGL